MDIYLDVVFLWNLVINYLILLVTAKLSKSGTSNLRLFLGALLGASYVVLMVLLPDLKIYTTLVAKVLLSAAIVLVSFGLGKLQSFIKTLLIFYVSTFVFAGACFAAIYMNRSGGIVKNGIIALFFVDSDWTMVLLGIATAAIILRVVWEAVQRKLLKEKLLVRLIVSFDKKTICTYALVDTGNSLHDPLTNMPVVVVEFNTIKDILPREIRNIFESNTENDLNNITATISCSTWFNRFRLIPFTSLGKENGMLIGFKPDYIEIDKDNEKKGISNVIVGIYNRALSRNEKYKALLNPELI